MEFHFAKGLKHMPDARFIRQQVFIQEQGFSPENEFDETDAFAWHGILVIGEKAIATARLFPGEGKTYKIGRLAVLPEYRKCGAGRCMMEHLLEEARKLGAEKVRLSAQVQAEGFYRKLGFSKTNEPPTEDEGVPHVYMEKRVL